MPELLSSVLKVERKKLDDLGVLNVYVDMDSNYYINLKLLENTNNIFFKESYSKILQHWKDIYSYLKKSKNEKDIFFEAALKLFYYPEINELCIGLGCGKTGRGIASLELRKKFLLEQKKLSIVDMMNQIFFY